nr:MAG TPA: hypothetical protein [Caudoviricetes sp.]
MLVILVVASLKVITTKLVAFRLANKERVLT